MLLFVSCGKTHPGATGASSAVGAPLAAPRQGRASTAPTIPLADVLHDIDATPAPKGVSAETWTALTTELKRLLVARAAAEAETGGDGKSVSIAPVALIDKVTDLHAASNRAGTQATLTWTEALAGDCDNDGQVFISDLQPIAAHYGEKSTGPGSPAYLADADGDGQVGITDLQPVAANYMAHLQGYRVYRGRHPVLTTTWEQQFRLNAADPASTDWSIDRPFPPPANSHPTYTYTDDISSLTDKEYVRYKVVPYGDGSEGIASAEGMMVPPSYWVVSGAITDADIGGGVDGVLVTITPGGLTGTTGKDGTYAIGGVQNGNYTVTATKEFYTFAPATADVTVTAADLPGVNFAATLHAQTVSGKVAYANGVGLPGAMVSASPGGQTATTAADGSYTLTRILQGSFTTVTPAKIGFLFSPPNRAVTVSTTDVSGVNFAVAPPAWPKFHANAQNTGLSPYVGAQTNALKWSFGSVGAGFDSSPAIGSDGTVYIQCDNNDKNLYALNPTDGSVKWSHLTNGSYSSPALGADGTVYFGSEDHNIYALNPSDGSVKWTYTTYWLVRSSPAIGADGTVYIGSEDHYIYALNPANGSVKWKHHTGDMVDSSPAIGVDGTVYVGGGDGNVYALNPADGSMKWSYNTGGEVYSSPAIGADGTVHISSGYNVFAVYALNPADGSVKWTSTTTAGSPVLGADGTVYVGSNDGNLYALNPADGSVKWSCATGGSPNSSPAIGADGTLYVGSGYNVYALNPSDGSVKWSYATGRPVSGLAAIGVDGTVYIGGPDRFFAFGS